MKRFFSLLLTVAMLFSLCVIPAYAEEQQAEVSLEGFTLFKVDENTNKIITTSEKTSYDKGDLVAAKIVFKNNSNEYVNVMSYDMVVTFDNSAVTPYVWEDENGKPCGKTELIGAFDTFVSNVVGGNTIKISAADAYGKRAKANAAIDLAWVLFKVNDPVESGAAAFTLSVTVMKCKYGEGGSPDEIQILPKTSTVSVTGNPPELKSVSVTPDEAEYGSNAKLKLTATSTSGKDITSLVTFGVKNESSTDVTSRFTIAPDGTLSIGSNDAGTYTVTATPKAGACRGRKRPQPSKSPPRPSPTPP